MHRCGITKPAGKTTNPKLYIMNAWKTFHIRLRVFLVMNIRCSKNVEDEKNWIKTLI
jgi:hypothetical protein